MKYEVIVGNIGTVHDGDDEAKALETFMTYTRLSESGLGRAGHEEVTLFVDGEIEKEHIPKMEEVLDLTSQIIAYESGELETEAALRLFSRLVSSGMAWSLQGSYGREAKRFIEEGLLDEHGNIDWPRFEELFY